MKELIREVLNRKLDLLDDEYTRYSIHDEFSNYLVNAMNMLDKIDKFEDTKHTREIVYLTSEYRYTDVEQRMFLLTHFAHSLHELSEMHIYEVTVQRSKEYNENPTVDYVHTAIVIADFDYNHCINKDFKNDFEDEVLDALFDVRFNSLSATIKQLS